MPLFAAGVRRWPPSAPAGAARPGGGTARGTAQRAPRCRPAAGPRPARCRPWGLGRPGAGLPRRADAMPQRPGRRRTRRAATARPAGPTGLAGRGLVQDHQVHVGKRGDARGGRNRRGPPGQSSAASVRGGGPARSASAACIESRRATLVAAGRPCAAQTPAAGTATGLRDAGLQAAMMTFGEPLLGGQHTGLRHLRHQTYRRRATLTRPFARPRRCGCAPRRPTR